MIKRSFFLLLTLLSASLYANVKLPKIFSDHMVLQRNQPIHIWGWADANESIKVSLGKATRTTKASAQGKWEVNLPAMKEGGPYTLQVSGRNSIELKDIYLGDVWICSGQSNMEWPLSASANAKQEISQADHPMIRHFKIPRAVQVQPQDDVQGGQWQVCSPSTAGSFTAVGYFFARELYKELKVPIGLINSSWGGTMVETWTSSSSFFSHPEFAHLKNRIPTNLNATVLAQRQALETLIRNLQGKLPTPQEAKNFSLPSYDDAAWKTMNLPAAWENAGLPDVDGEVWFRREFDLPAGADLSNTTLSLGPIDDIDSTFVNGVLVGSVQQYDVPRIYRLPAALLKKGKNIIAVKVTDNQGGGGLYGTAGQMKLTAGDT
ncbi:MAG TPA: sialate O-acetylesterase, partial [Chitinophagaceae bacterium]|nr:sialate O-acetylesterase [Chitinophagaceae bacterium]